MENLSIQLTQKASVSFIKDLKANGCKFRAITKTHYNVEDTGKIRTAIRLVKERFGIRSIIVNNI